MLTKKIHNPWNMLIVSLIFTPLAAIIITAIDYRKLERKRWLFVAIAPFLISFGASFVDFIVFDSVVPQAVYPILMTLTYFLYQRKLQEEEGVVFYRGFMESLFVGIMGFVVMLPFLSFMLF